MDSLLNWMDCATSGTILGIVGILAGFFGWSIARMPPICFGKPRDAAEQDFFSWWHIPVQIEPGFFHSSYIDNCTVSVVLLKHGKVKQRADLCWQTDEGPRMVIDLERKRTEIVPVAIRSVLGQDFGVFPDSQRLPPFILPSHAAILTDSAVLLEGEISLPGLANRDYVLRLEIRREGKVIKKSNYYVLTVPDSSADNKSFDLHI
ncbi:MAG: hypothetical protein ACREQA_08080 [Candidatus Binatia bacterium]